MLDPACGDGRFLVTAYGHAIATDKNIRPELLGFERDGGFANAARKAIGENGLVSKIEALTESPKKLEGTIDVVVGNPPYLRSVALAKSDPELWNALKGAYLATSHGEWDLYGAFLEHTLRWLSPEGEAGMIIPSRWLTARNTSRLRKSLGTRGLVRGVVDFGATQVFPGATTYTSVVFLSRRKRSKIQVARRDAMGWSFGALKSAGFDEKPWHLLVGRSKVLLDSLQENSKQLGDLARIAKGTGTNADSVFVLNERNLLEKKIVRRCLRGRDIRGYGEAKTGPELLYPYDENGRLYTSKEMARFFPKAWRYLLSNRSVLEKRERGRFAGESFYQFGRPQNLAFHAEKTPKIVIPDIARDARALIDRSGVMCLDSAYAIRTRSDELPVELLLAVFNSRAIPLWLSLTGIPLRGGYVRLKTAYLNSLPIPKLDRVAKKIISAVRQEADRSVVEDLVRSWYGIEKPSWYPLSK